MLQLLLNFFNLCKFQIIHTCISTKNGNQDTQAAFIMEYFADCSDEVHKHTIGNLDTVSNFEFMFLRNFLLFIFKIFKDFIDF